ncbi:Na+/H+ antiporter subunit E [Salinisphaera sp.]|uniref:Na+/H+ antiporter subunit E n=1 Tax=Salinisphaera sp. TaxID=1914330 RepID=UPI000C5FBDC1|nr:Na+/H+ antiporter subunit E [Salinisphaera sp.]MAS08484.1 cation transporter [Salinisphaera sp.]
MRHVLALVIGLVVLWLALSGHYNVVFLSLGAVSCGLVFWLCWRMRLINDECVPISIVARLPAYTVWLLAEIARSNVEVVRQLLGPARNIHPSLVRVRVSQRTDLGRAIFANSVTLTPGTVTIELQGGQAVIHSLSRIADTDVTEGEMNAKVCWLESPSSAHTDSERTQ